MSWKPRPHGSDGQVSCLGCGQAGLPMDTGLSGRRSLRLEVLFQCSTADPGPRPAAPYLSS
eukprot:2212706-Pyramimonas_sp.AAC.1